MGKSRVIHHTIVRINSSNMFEWVQGLQRFDYNVGLVLPNSAALVSPFFHVPEYFLQYWVPIRKKMMPTSVNFRRELRMGASR